MQSGGRVEIPRADLAALCTDLSGGLESMRQQKKQIDYFTKLLREAGFPIHNDFLIWGGFPTSVALALQKCGADWLSCEYRLDGINIYEWGTGGPHRGIYVKGFTLPTAMRKQSRLLL